MKYFGVVEVGGCSVKGYGYIDGKLEEIPSIPVKLKENYQAKGKFTKEDKETLYQYVLKVKEDYGVVEVYGTSFFRKLWEEVKKSFLVEFFSKTGINFNIPTLEEECKYTVYGAIANIKHSNNIGVLVGGSTFTELAIVKDRQIIERQSLNFNAMDITNRYPDLKEDIATSNIKELLNETCSRMENIQNKTDILILAGGNYIMFYESMHYPLKENIFFLDDNEPYYIEKENMERYDEQYFYQTSLEQVKKENANTKIWWDGTRGMRICIDAVVNAIDAKFIVPTKISMTSGIIEMLKNSN